MSTVDEIKARLDIVAYIGESVPLRAAGQRFKANCPFHAERTPSFIVDPERGTWRCFGACAEGGDIFSFAMKRHGWNFREALEELARRAGVELRPRTPEQTAREKEAETLRGLLTAMAEQYHHWLLAAADEAAAAALRYAREERALSEETLRTFQVGYAPSGWQNSWEFLRSLGYRVEQAVAAGVCGQSDNGHAYDRFRARLIIPIRDARGQVLGFGGRALDDDLAKYLNSPQSALFDKSRLLFALDRARPAIRETGIAVVTEGYLDAIQAHQAGYRNVVAQMGTALTEHQLRGLLPSRGEERRIILALDADAAGQTATRRGLETARRVLTQDFGGRLGVDLRILQLPDARDPDDLLREEPLLWPTLVAEAHPLPQYVIDQETGTLAAEATIQEREAAARRILPLLLATESDLLRRDNVQRLARRLRIVESDLLALAMTFEKRSAAPKRVDAHEEAPPPAESAPAASDEMATPIASEPASLAQLEAGLLRLLLREPRRLSDIDRLLGELLPKGETAGNESSLPLSQLYLGNFGDDDFIENDHRALIHLLREALAAGAEDPIAHLRAQSEAAQLNATLGALLEEELDWLDGRLHHGLSEDLRLHRRRNPPDALLETERERDLFCGALDLRRRRLQRMLDELYFLMDSTADAQEFAMQLAAWARARRLLDERLAQLRGRREN